MEVTGSPELLASRVGESTRFVDEIEAIVALMGKTVG